MRGGSKIQFIRRPAETADVAAHPLQHADESLQIGLGDAYEGLVHRVDGELLGGVLQRHALCGDDDVVHTSVLLGHGAGDEAFLLQVVDELRHRVLVLLDDEGDGLLGEGALVPERVHHEVLLCRQVDAVLPEDLREVFLEPAIQDVDVNASLLDEYHIITFLGLSHFMMVQ